jgi:hypothetical protein
LNRRFNHRKRKDRREDGFVVGREDEAVAAPAEMRDNRPSSGETGDTRFANAIAVVRAS